MIGKKSLKDVQHGSHQHTGEELRCSEIVNSFCFLWKTPTVLLIYTDKAGNILSSDRGDKEVIFRMERREDPEEVVRMHAQI